MFYRGSGLPHPLGGDGPKPFELDGRRFLLRRVRFPPSPSPEWFVVDLFQHHAMAGVSLTTLEAGLTRTLRAGRWEESRLREAAREFGTHDTSARIERCLQAGGRGCPSTRPAR